jgi:hypothetical protein
MLERYKLARSEEIRLAIERWQRDREAVVDALIFNARLSAGWAFGRGLKLRRRLRRSTIGCPFYVKAAARLVKWTFA